MEKELQLRLEGMLSFIDTYGASGFDDSKIEELESIILECNSKMTGTATNAVADSIYDTLYDMLKTVNPESGILSEIWEEDGDITDYTELLQSNPMMSIETAKSYDCKELTEFINRMPDAADYFASYKINGHGIRVVFDQGNLVSATSRARSSAGRDITRHLRVLLGDYNENLADFGVVELRGELCLPISNLELAREYNPAIKSAFSAVASLVRPSATDEEIRLMDFLCYGFITEGMSFETREEEFRAIEYNTGYKTPENLLIEEADRDSLLDYIQSTVTSFEEGYEEFGYFCDGVVFELNNRELFRELGTNGNHNNGNVALKVGVWEQCCYVGYVQSIEWTRGKSKLSPVAIVADEPDMAYYEGGKIANWDDLGVLTAQGNKVRRVPLYEPKNILILDAYPGNQVNFRYGGEAGVVPCFPDGRLLKEDAARDILLGEDSFVE